MSQINENDILVDIKNGTYHASYKEFYSKGLTREDAIKRVIKEYTDSLNNESKIITDDIDENEIVVEHKNGEYKAYYKGSFAAAKTYDEAVERVKIFMFIIIELSKYQ